MRCRTWPASACSSCRSSARAALLALFRTTLFDCGITVIAILRALLGALPGGVSRKVGERRLSLLLLPQIVAAAALVASLAVARWDDRPGASTVAIVWAGINAFLLIPPLTAASRRQATVRIASVTTSLLLVVLLATALFGSARTSRNVALADPSSASGDRFVVHAGGADGAPRPAGPGADPSTATSLPGADRAADPLRLAPPVSGTYWGILSEEVQQHPQGVARWTGSHDGAAPQIVQWFQQWGTGENRFREDWVRNVAAAGAVPMITWEPWAKPDGEYADPTQSRFGLRAIASGEFDTYIRSWARAAATYGGPILLRFMHEFDGYWYPWSIGLRDQTPAQFVAAWRHVHAIFVQEGAVNVSWVWSIFGSNHDPGPAYPGDDVVDWVAGTVLNTGRSEYGGWTSYSTLTENLYPELVKYGKPVMLAEIGTNRTGGDAAAWIDEAFSAAGTDHSLVKAIMLLDMPYDERTDYRLDDSMTRQLAQSTADPSFTARLDVEPATP